MPLTVLQLSDLHLLDEVKATLLGCATQATFRAVFEALTAPPPDLLLLTGDIAQDASPRGYERLADLIRALNVPCAAIPGNHDDPESFRQIARRAPFRLERSFEMGGWRFVLLDSHVPGETYGRLSPESLHWLENELAAHANQLTVLVMHHPPAAVGTPWLDRIGLQNAESLGDIVANHKQVHLMLNGHVHQEHQAPWRGLTFLTTPSTCFQFEPGADHFALDAAAAPGGRRLRLYADGTFETSVERVATAACTPDPVANGY